jgi:hypothetical protein
MVLHPRYCTVCGTRLEPKVKACHCGNADLVESPCDLDWDVTLRANANDRQFLKSIRVRVRTTS